MPKYPDQLHVHLIGQADAQQREEFGTEGEAIAFIEGMEAVTTNPDCDRAVSHDMFVDGNKWVVEYSIF